MRMTKKRERKQKKICNLLFFLLVGKEQNTMVIVRDGKEIELTKDEIYSAYLEQESMFDLENIDLNMEVYLSKEEYELLKDNKDFMEEAAYELRRNQDKYDMDYEFALKEAFDTVKMSFLDNEKEEEL